MERSSNILAWLGRRGEKEIIHDARVDLEKAMECVRELGNSLDALGRNDQPAKEQAIAAIKRAEREGDEIRRRLMDELAKGILLPPDRQDLMLLNERINDVADNAKGAGRLLEFLHEPPPPEIARLLVEDAGIAEKAVARLEHALDALGGGDLSAVLENCAQVETLEEEADDRKRDMLGALLNSNAPAAILMILFQLIDTVEKVVDSINDASDLVRMLAIKTR